MIDQSELGIPLNRNGRVTPDFAHPAEEIFARILDFYGIEWRHEPKTFPLEWDEKGTMMLISSFLSAGKCVT